MNGQRVRFNSIGGSNKKNASINAEYVYKSGIDPENGKYTNNGINMNKATFNQKHPKTHEFIAQHERGHIEARKQNRKVLQHTDSMNKSVMQFPKEMQDLAKEALQLRKDPNTTENQINNLVKKFDKVSAKYKDKDDDCGQKMGDLKIKIRDLINKHKVETDHGNDEEEYMADNYAVAHLGKHGKQILYNAIKDTKKNSNKYKVKDKSGYTKLMDDKLKYNNKEIKELNKLKNLNKHDNKKNIIKRYNIENSLDDTHKKTINQIDNSTKMGLNHEKFKDYMKNIDKNYKDETNFYNKQIKLNNDNHDNILDEREHINRNLENEYNARKETRKSKKEFDKKVINHAKDEKKNIKHELESRRKINDLLNKK